MILRLIFLTLLLLLTGVSSSALAQAPSEQAISLGLPGLAWRVQIHLADYEIDSNATKPDGRRYLLASQHQSGIIVSVTLETAKRKPRQNECSEYLKRRSQEQVIPGKKEDMKTFQQGEWAVCLPSSRRSMRPRFDRAT